jgi:hypothetical protein
LAAAALLAGVIVTAVSAEARAGGAPATDANLVTALDVSDSIMRHEEWIEFAGMIHALERDDFVDAVAAGSHGRIGFAVIVWSSGAQPEVIVPWTVIESKRDARRVSDALRAARQLHGFDARMGTDDGPVAYRGGDGGSDARARRTDLSAALEFSTDLLRAAPFVTSREVINICGNGADNVHASPAAARDRALAAGMVVNGLTIGATPDIADYYRDYVQGGPGSFVLEVANPADVAAAMLEKLLRDLNVVAAPPEMFVSLGALAALLSGGSAVARQIPSGTRLGGWSHSPLPERSRPIGAVAIRPPSEPR